MMCRNLFANFQLIGYVKRSWSLSVKTELIYVLEYLWPKLHFSYERDGELSAAKLCPFSLKLE